MSAQFQVGFVQNAWLWLLAAFLFGLLVEWLLEIFFFRRKTMEQQSDLETRLAAAAAELDATKQSLVRVENDARACASDRDAALQAQNDLKRQLDARAQQIAQLDADLETARGAQVEAVNAGARLQRELDGVKTEKSGLLEQIATFTAGAATAAASIKLLERERGDLGAQLEASQKAEADLNAQLADRDRQLAQLHARVGELEGELKTARGELDTAANARAALEKDLDAFKNEKAGLLGQIATFTAGAATAAASIKLLEKDKSDLAAQLAAAQQANADLQTQFDQVNAGYRAQLDANAKLDAELDKLRAAVESEANARGALTRELEGLRESYTRLERELGALRGENARLRAQLEAETDEKGAWLKKIGVVLGGAGIGALAAKGLEGKDANAQLEALGTELTNLRAELERAQSAKLAADAELEALRPQLAKVQGDYQAALDSRVAVNAELEKLRADFDAESSARGSLVQELEGLRGAYTHLKHENETQRADLTALERTVAQEKSDKGNLLEQIAAFTAGAATSALTLKVLEKDKADLDAQLALARADIEKANQAHAALTQELDGLRGSYTRLEREQDALRGENARLRAQLDAEQETRGGLFAKLASFGIGAGAGALAVKATGTDAAGLETQLAALRAELDAKAALDRELVELRADRDREANTRALLFKELDSLRTAHSLLESESTALRSANQDLLLQLEDARQEKSGLAEKLALLGAGAVVGNIATPLSVLSAETESEIIPPLPLEASTEPQVLPPLPLEMPAAPEVEAVAGVMTLGVAAAETKKRKPRRRVTRDPEDETPYTLACPQHLSDVYGIGTVFEQRLYGAGIGTYWELYKAPFKILREVLQVRGIQRESIDLQAIRSDALRLAKETASKGREWDGAAPDDFEPLAGIGHTFEKRLYDAGICTYKALAAATVKELREIVGMDLVTQPNFKEWKKQARQLAARKKKNAVKTARAK